MLGAVSCSGPAAVLLSGPLSKALGRKFRREREDKPGGEGDDPKP